MSKSADDRGKPEVAKVKITEIPVNPNDLGQGCKKIPVSNTPPTLPPPPKSK